MADGAPEQLDDRILVLAPTARDAATTGDIFAATGFRHVPCTSIADVCREAARGAGAAIVTVEAILGDRAGALRGLLDGQPPWSDLPLIVLTPPGAESPKLLRVWEAVRPAMLLKRPVEVATLVTAARAALRDRQRQYTARDLLAERQRTAEEIRVERERYRVTLASIGDGVIATDTDGRVTFLNAAAQELTGWDPAAARGRPLREVFHIVNETTGAAVANPAARALRDGVAVGPSNHTVLIARDGTERPIDDSAAPIRDHDGAVVGAVLVFRDITERKQSESTQARLGAIVESSDDAIIGKSLGGEITSWNGGATRLFGWTAAEAVGRPDTLTVPPDRREEQAGILARLKRGERVDHFETIRVAKDGRRLDVSLTVSPVRDRNGQIVGVSKVARDVTARKRAEDAVRFLADASASLAELVDYESTLRRIAHLAVDRFADWCVVDVVDDGGRRRLAFTRAESDEVARARAADVPESGMIPHVLRTGEPEVVSDLAAIDLAAAPQGADRVRRLRERGVRSYLCVPLLSRGRVIGGMTFLSHSDRRRFGPDELRVARDLAGRVTSAIENAQLYSSLQEQDRRKDEFLATLAHELRNPLAPVRNGVQILRLNRRDDAAVERTLAMMDRQLAHMVHLVDDLLDVARVSSGKVVLRKERVELRAVVDSAVEATRQVIEVCGHELVVSLPAKPLVFDADKTRLAQVLANLLNNAAKYTTPGGRIELSAVREGPTAVVRVADTGVGIPADMLPRIFDMFTQVGTSLERSQGGLGIGLTLVRRLVEMHGGTVAAESPGPDRGSAFTVRLPLSVVPAAAAPGAAAPDDASAEAGLRVLVVDDNRDAADSLAMLLELRGHDVRTAHDGPDALRALGSYSPHLILLDIGLPGMNGYEVARRIRESAEFRGVTLVALTGWGQDEDRRRTKEAGFDRHLVKSADVAEVDAILKEVAGHRIGVRV